MLWYWWWQSGICLHQIGNSVLFCNLYFVLCSEHIWPYPEQGYWVAFQIATCLGKVLVEGHRWEAITEQPTAITFDCLSTAGPTPWKNGLSTQGHQQWLYSFSALVCGKRRQAVLKTRCFSEPREQTITARKQDCLEREKAGGTLLTWNTDKPHAHQRNEIRHGKGVSQDLCYFSKICNSLMLFKSKVTVVKKFHC